MPSRPRQQQPSGLGCVASEKANPAAYTLAFPSPVERARINPTRQALLTTRCDMGEHGHVADSWGLGNSLIMHMDND